MVFCFVVHYLRKRLDAGRDVEEVAVVRGGGGRKPESMRGGAAGVLGMRASASGSVRLQAGAVGAGLVRPVAARGGAQSVSASGPRVLRAGAAGPRLLRADSQAVSAVPDDRAPFYMTTVDNLGAKLWLALPEGDVFDYAQPEFRARPTDSSVCDERFRWKFVRLPSHDSTLFAIVNVHTGRLLQYCGTDRLCLQTPRSAINWQRMDWDMIFAMSGGEGSPTNYTVAARGNGGSPIFAFTDRSDRSAGGALRVRAETRDWSARANNSALWTFEEAR